MPGLTLGCTAGGGATLDCVVSNTHTWGSAAGGGGGRGPSAAWQVGWLGPNYGFFDGWPWYKSLLSWWYI